MNHLPVIEEGRGLLMSDIPGYRINNFLIFVIELALVIDTKCCLPTDFISPGNSWTNKVKTINALIIIQDGFKIITVFCNRSGLFPNILFYQIGRASCRESE